MPQAALILASLLALHPPLALSGKVVPSRAGLQAASTQTTKDLSGDAVIRTRVVVEEVIAASYPELKGADIRIKPFRSRSDYFKTSFGILQFFFVRMRYLVFVNPRVFELQAPEGGIRAIVAHELAHIAYFKKRNRVRLLGLARLTSRRFTAKFERRSDLRAISLGYGEGLKDYRRWLYRNVPASKLAEKRRNYFSPEEIDAIGSALRARPELLEYWLKRVPLSLDGILSVPPR